MNEAQKKSLDSEPTSSLIERAVQAFDRRQFVPPAMPELPSGLTPAPQAPVAPQATATPQALVTPQATVVPAAPVAQAAPAPAPQAQVYHAPAYQAPVAAAYEAPVYQAPVQPAPAQPAPVARATPGFRVDRARLQEQGIIRPDGGAASIVEEFRIVKRQLIDHSEDLRRRGGGGAAQRIMVSSPHPGEGKTYCSLNLAMSMAAEKDTDVLLVDFDLARSGVLTALGAPNGPGLMDALVDPSIDIRSCVMATDIPGLSVLPGGRPTNSDSEYLSSARAATVLDLLTEGRPDRIVLFDTPPVLVAAVPADLAALVGQAVLVVRADKTAQGAISDTVSLLSGCPNIQLLLNAVQFSPSGRRFGSYNGYRG